MNNIDVIMQHAEQHCENNGSRLTLKRKQVLTSLIKSGKATSAYDIIDLCEQMFGEKIPAMSVYRILEFLESLDLVHKLNLANKYVACSQIGCDHVHGVPLLLVCDACNDVEEIKVNKKFTAEINNNVSKSKFKVVKPHLEIKCICSKCSATKLDKQEDIIYETNSSHDR